MGVKNGGVVTMWESTAVTSVRDVVLRLLLFSQ